MALPLGQLKKAELRSLAPEVWTSDRLRRRRRRQRMDESASVTDESEGGGVEARAAGHEGVIVGESRRMRSPYRARSSDEEERVEAEEVIEEEDRSAFSWSSYGRQWERDWQEQREREIDAERHARLQSEVQASTWGSAAPPR